MAAIIVGELPRSFDPAVSEWRNPAEFILGHPTAKVSCTVSINSECQMPNCSNVKSMSKSKCQIISTFVIYSLGFHLEFGF